VAQPVGYPTVRPITISAKVCCRVTESVCMRHDDLNSVGTDFDVILADGQLPAQDGHDTGVTRIIIRISESSSHWISLMVACISSREILRANRFWTTRKWITTGIDPNRILNSWTCDTIWITVEGPLPLMCTLRNAHVVNSRPTSVCQ